MQSYVCNRSSALPLPIIRKIKRLNSTEMAKYKKTEWFLIFNQLFNFVYIKWIEKMANQFLVLVSVLLLIGLALAQEVHLRSQQEPEPKVVREKNNNDGSGNYLFT